MSKGVNKVIILGNLGKDPDTRVTQSGKPVSVFPVATSDFWKDKNSGQNQQKTEWHRIVMFDRLAEIAQEFLKKGSKVYLEGKLVTRKWKDQGGNDRYTTEIVANELQMLDAKPSGGDNPEPSQQVDNNFDNFDDDIPF